MLGFVVDFFLVFGGVLGYIPQYRDIARTKDASGFSPKICLILLVANILRVVFWFGKRFEAALLLQSLVMIACQVVLLELCVRLKSNSHRLINSGGSGGSMEKIEFTRNYLIGQFWDWRNFNTYIAFLFSLFLVTFAFATTFDFPTVWETLGALALGIEALLPLPQYLSNRQRKSCEGMSPILIGSWIVGDSAKTLIFLSKNAPFQFIACGVVQLILDTLVLHQMLILYPNNSAQTPTSLADSRAAMISAARANGGYNTIEPNKFMA